MRIERLPLKKLDNTRDLGGLPAEGGKKIKSGKLLRSGRLYKLPDSTVNALKAMGLETVVDMRIDVERGEYPSTIIEGVNYVQLPLVCTATTGITHQKSMAGTMLKESKRIKTEFGTADNYMASMYSIILFDGESQKKLRIFFDLILQNKRCILWHCNAGKDRTGIAAMLLEGLLGVDESVIIEDYVATKKFQHRKRLLQRIGLTISPIPHRFKQILYALMDAKPQYIRGAIDAIKQKYGSIAEYCKQALHVTEEEIKFLKNEYLE